MGEPRLSVVVPAYENGAALEVTLGSLTRQTVPADQFEVIVGDDGSAAPLAPIVDAYRDRLRATTVRADTNRGRAANRNAAAARATAATLLFLDSDTVAHPTLLERHLAFHDARGGGPGVLLGRRHEVDWAGADTLVRGELPSAAMLDHYRGDPRDWDGRLPVHQADLQRAPWVLGFSHNASMDRATFVALGGFDESFVKWGYEDLELFYRVFHSHGDSPDIFAFDDEALSYHLPQFRSTVVLLAATDNLRQVARKHPRYDVEVLYSAAASMWQYVARVRLYGDSVAACLREGLGRPECLPAGIREALATRRVLVAGCGVQRLDLGEGSHTFDHDAPPSATNWHLLGLMLQPFKTGQFEQLVNVDLWRFFMPGDLNTFVTRALRKADEILLVASHGGPAQESLLPLAYIADVEYAAQLFRPHFKVELIRYDDATVISIR